MAKSMMTGTVPSSGRSGTAAVMTQNEQTAEERVVGGDSDFKYGR